MTTFRLQLTLLLSVPGDLTLSYSRHCGAHIHFYQPLYSLFPGFPASKPSRQLDERFKESTQGTCDLRWVWCVIEIVRRRSATAFRVAL